jgi:hypothetical protein
MQWLSKPLSESVVETEAGENIAKRSLSLTFYLSLSLFRSIHIHLLSVVSLHLPHASVFDELAHFVGEQRQLRFFSLLG